MINKIKYIAYVVVSIDGQITHGYSKNRVKNKKSKIEWTSKEDWSFFQKSLEKVDAVIVGHNTYKIAINHLKHRNAIVLTSKVSKIEIEGKTVFFNPKKYNLKNFIQSKDYKKIAILGGSNVYNFCLINKMLDELYVTIEPYVFGRGVSMFSGKFKKYHFILKSAKKLNKKGTLLVKYKNKSR